MDLQVQAFEGLLDAFRKKTLSEKRLTLSLARILRLKEKYIVPKSPPSLKKAKEIVGQESHREVLSRVLAPPEKKIASLL
jgi:hypothetical protein